jgi:transposase
LGLAPGVGIGYDMPRQGGLSVKAYSMDLRERVIGDCDAGLPTGQVAIKYSVSPAWVRRLKQHRRERGDIVPRHGGHRPRAFDRQRLRTLVEEAPDATLLELRERLGVKCSLSAICAALQALKLTYKKSPSTPPSKTAPTWRPVALPGGLRGWAWTRPG